MKTTFKVDSLLVRITIIPAGIMAFITGFFILAAMSGSYVPSDALSFWAKSLFGIWIVALVAAIFFKTTQPKKYKDFKKKFINNI